jgi:hypothetical protein
VLSLLQRGRIGSSALSNRSFYFFVDMFLLPVITRPFAEISIPKDSRGTSVYRQGILFTNTFLFPYYDFMRVGKTMYTGHLDLGG